MKNLTFHLLEMSLSEEVLKTLNVLNILMLQVREQTLQVSLKKTNPLKLFLVVGNLQSLFLTLLGIALF